MELTKKKRNHAIAFNITPMIDIVFLLIIFFMTVSQINQVVEQPMPLPVVNAGNDTRTLATLTINMVADGRLNVGGSEYSLGQTIEAVKFRVAQQGGTAQSTRLLLRCDKRCPSENVNRLLRELASAGIPAINISVTADE